MSPAEIAFLIGCFVGGFIGFCAGSILSRRAAAKEFTEQFDKYVLRTMRGQSGPHKPMPLHSPERP